jgi:two-component system, NarL family, sensor histidine kinase BarA
MPTSVEEGSLERFRSEARSIRQRADTQTFAILSGAALSVAGLFAAAILASQPGSFFLWPIAASLVLMGSAIWWTYRTGHVESGIGVLAALMVVGISGVIFVQKGSNAPALVYGLATVAVAFIAGRFLLAVALGLWLTAWTASVTWAAKTGRLVIDAPNPFGLENARFMAFVVALVVIGSAARIVHRRRRGLDAILERALQLTEAERDAAQVLAERRARRIAEISHEIRTPMTGIVGAAQLLSQKSVSPTQRQLLSIQRQSAERLLQLVNSILDQAKSESEASAPVDAHCSPRLIAAEVSDLFAPQANRHDIEIIWTADPSVPASIVGDGMRMRQILSNLVSNALKFTDRGSVHVHLIRSTDGRLRIEVRDTGRGIGPDRLDAIFKRFVSDATSDTTGPSTGLGLSISRDLARAMGGEVSATSTPGSGSCFVFELPCAPPTPQADEGAHGEALPPGRLLVLGASAPLELQLRSLLGELNVDARFAVGPPHGAEPSDEPAAVQATLVDAWIGHGQCVDALPSIMDDARRNGSRVIVVSSIAQDAAFGALDDVWQLFRPLSREALREALAWSFDRQAQSLEPARNAARPLRVLLVDDNAVNLIIGRVMLQGMAADVVVAQGGQAALDESRARAFDLILMDLQMPDMDGLEATRRLRAHEQAAGLARTPVVAVTGLVEADIRAGCRDAGINAVLQKPYTIDQLHEVVAAHTRRVMDPPTA